MPTPTPSAWNQLWSIPGFIGLNYLWPDAPPESKVNLNITDKTIPDKLLAPFETTKNIPYVGQYINPLTVGMGGLGLGMNYLADTNNEVSQSNELIQKRIKQKRSMNKMSFYNGMLKYFEDQLNE